MRCRARQASSFFHSQPGREDVVDSSYSFNNEKELSSMGIILIDERIALASQQVRLL